VQSFKPQLLRFFADGRALLPRKGVVLVACSGGPDSVALAYALQEFAKESNFPYEFHLAHVNHKLRGQASSDDARFVKRLAAHLQWPYHEKTAAVRIKSGNLEETARVKRYDALMQMAQKAGSQVILTAHTQDDQAETILMNLLRGTAAVGLGGMNTLRVWPGSDVIVGRPFLFVAKKSVREALRKRKIAFRSDASNTNQKFLRNWLRNKVVPLLERRAPGFQQRLATMATILRDEEKVWNATMEQMESRFLRRERQGRLLDFKGVLSYSAAAQRRFLRRVMGGDALDFDGVERLRNWMAAAPQNGRIWQGRRGWVAERLSKSRGAPSTKLFLIKNENSK